MSCQLCRGCILINGQLFEGFPSDFNSDHLSAILHDGYLLEEFRSVRARLDSWRSSFKFEYFHKHGDSLWVAFEAFPLNPKLD